MGKEEQKHMDEAENEARYYIDVEGAASEGRNIAAIIAQRRCYACQQEDSEEPEQVSNAGGYIKRIAQQCSGTDDYLLPDTPLKEGMFRVILAGGNEPITAEQVSEALSERWAMSPYPRDLSPGAIGRVLDHSESYSIKMVPLPETEPEPVEADPTETAAVEQMEGAPPEVVDEGPGVEGEDQADVEPAVES